jgi:hypothetical protein
MNFLNFERVRMQVICAAWPMAWPPIQIEMYLLVGSGVADFRWQKWNYYRSGTAKYTQSAINQKHR